MVTRAIERSRVKAMVLTLGALAFVVTGVWMVTIDDRYRGLPTPVIGGASILFFGACLVYGVRKLFDKTPALIVRGDGFDDRSSAVAVGFVPWSDVREIAVMRVSGQRFIAVRVHDTQKYVDRGTSFQRMARRANTGLCGTPVTISASALRISFDELKQLLEAGVNGSLGSFPGD